MYSVNLSSAGKTEVSSKSEQCIELTDVLSISEHCTELTDVLIRKIVHYSDQIYFNV